MKKTRAVVAGIVAFICVMSLVANSHPVHAASGTVSTDHALYPVWRIGGTVRVTAQNLASNGTYYLWLQKPRQPTSYFTKSSFTAVKESTLTPIPIVISPTDPPGTYTLTLSRSPTNDTIDTIAHFGVLGTDSASYERTKIVTVAGGGFAANSSVHIELTPALPGFPLNVTTQGNGEFDYTFKLPPAAATGTLNVSITGFTFDKHQTEMASSSFTVKATAINVRALNGPVPTVERTYEVNATYQLSYSDGSPVTAANATASIISPNLRSILAPLVLLNSTSGDWIATWVPPPSANTTAYHFQMSPANLTDAYGNKGQGSPLNSQYFQVAPTRLRLTIQANRTQQRTESSIITISAAYQNGADVAAISLAGISVIQTNGRQSKLNITLNGPQALAHLRIPVNATLGNWTLSYNMQDPWRNSGSDEFTVQVLAAFPVFQVQAPSITERTTFLNVTGKVSYPDGTPMNLVTLAISNQPLTPILNPTTSVWSSSYYITQNATLGVYNITWAAHDSYGNGGNDTSTTLVVPARFRFLLPSNNSTVNSFTNIDIPVVVKYPNGSLLTYSFGHADGYYTNSTGGTVTLPLAYNQTDNTWHMFFSAPEEGNLTFSFKATDSFGNSGLIQDSYNLKIITSSRLVTQRLIIAGIIGALIPIALLVWAIVTISTKRRKHRP